MSNVRILSKKRGKYTIKEELFYPCIIAVPYQGILNLIVAKISIENL